MQGPGSLLNVLTIPPGAIPGQQRIVIDGIRGAIFEYGTGAGIGITQPDNPLVSSWASKAGTDPFGNAYPQGFNIGSGSVFEGTDFIINANGIFFYSGTPAAGNLVASWVPPGVTADSFGNTVFPDSISFYGIGGGPSAVLGISSITGSAIVKFPSNNANEAFAAELATALIGSGSTEFISTAFFSAQLNTVGHRDSVFVQLNTPNFGGTSLANGALGYSNDAQAVTDMAVWDGNSFRVQRGPATAFSDVTQRNCTTSTQTQITPTYTIPANTMQAGTAWELELLLAGNQNPTTATTLTFIFSIFMTGSATTTALTLPTGFAAANAQFRGSCRLMLQCKTPGATGVGSLFLNGEVKMSVTSFALANSFCESVSSANAQGPNANIDTTLPCTVAIFANWGTSGSLGGLASKFIWVS